MKKQLLFIIALMGITILHSCGIADDREAKAKDYLQQKISDQSGNALKMESFTKTNGTEQEVMGVKMYVLEWAAQVSVLNDVWKAKNGIIGDWHDFKTTQKAEGSVFGDLHLNAGASIHFIGKSKFKKTEKGWMVYAADVSSYEVQSKDSAPAK